MKYEIGYALVYDYYKSSYGQGSWRPQVARRGFLEWDGTESFEDLIKRHHSEFVAEAFNAEGDKNHRIELTSLRIGGERSHVVMSIEKQTISLPVFKGQEV